MVVVMAARPNVLQPHGVGNLSITSSAVTSIPVIRPPSRIHVLRHNNLLAPSSDYAVGAAVLAVWVLGWSCCR